MVVMFENHDKNCMVLVYKQNFKLKESDLLCLFLACGID